MPVLIFSLNPSFIMPSNPTIKKDLKMSASPTKSKILQLLFCGAMVSKIGGKFTLISNPLEGTSSYQAGLSYGDIILEIDGKKMGS